MLVSTSALVRSSTIGLVCGGPGKAGGTGCLDVAGEGNAVGRTVGVEIDSGMLGNGGETNCIDTAGEGPTGGVSVAMTLGDDL